MKVMKFEVKTPKRSAKIQKVLFKMGYLWSGESVAAVEQTDKPYLYTTETGKILYGTQVTSFQDNAGTQFTFVPASLVEVKASSRFVSV